MRKCCAETLPTDARSSEQHACCQHKTENEHKCQAVLPDSSARENSCKCAFERITLGSVRKPKMLPEIENLATFLPASRELYSKFCVEDQQHALRLAALANDELKPGKLYLLKRALLN